MSVLRRYQASRTQCRQFDGGLRVPGYLLTGLLVFGACLLQPSGVRAADEIPGIELCDGPISRITFTGNRVTQPQVMLRELELQPGEACSVDRVIDGMQRLADLGLFRAVRAEFVPSEDGVTPPLGAATPFDPAVATRGVELRYVVREKFYFVGVPRFSRTSDGEIRVGASLQWDNFLGRLHELKLVSEWRQEDEGRGRGGFVHSIEYDVPRFLQSDYGFRIRLRAEDRQVDLAVGGEDFGEGRQNGQVLGLTLARWLNANNGVQGLRVLFGVTAEQREYRVDAGALGPLRGGVSLDWRIGVESRRVQVERFRRIGHRIGGRFRVASDSLGSDFNWTRLDAWASFYRPIGNTLNNFNAQVSVGLSDGAPFGELFYSIGGGEVLRGIAKGAREGDIQLLVNLEYLSPWFLRPSLRSVVFADIGNVWRRNAVDLLDLEARAGVGLRWKLEALSKTDLRLDLAWDPDDERLIPYISTSLTF